MASLPGTGTTSSFASEVDVVIDAAGKHFLVVPADVQFFAETVRYFFRSASRICRIDCDDILHGSG